ncbi:hypothetical protein V1512DRAFT_266463 [Lipomyces arxii]|uniref:uncharacterized protein n=1 Tax=Lipomyces arxii TaxID=56418 RepID=UPI0034CE2F76
MNLLNLPDELIEHILDLVHADNTTDNCYSSSHKHRVHLTKRLASFTRNVLPVCHRFHDLGLSALYSHVHIGHPRAFDVFRYQLITYPYLGRLVRCLDFSDFTSIGLGRTRKMNREIQMVTSSTITDALQRSPNLREFLVSESIEDELGRSVISSLFSLSHLEAVDFCGASGSVFSDALMNTTFVPSASLSRISFHECVAIPRSVYESLLPQLGNLARLDLTHAQISITALMSIPATARITHLSLSKCRSLRGKDIVCFLTTHLSVTSGSLSWLSLQLTDLTAEDITRLLQSLSCKVRHLNLSSLPVEESHLALLPENLEEVSLGYADLSIDALIKTFSRRTAVTYLDLTGNPHTNLWVVGDMRLFKACPHILAWEFDTQRILAKLVDARIPNYVVVLGQGRRGWIFKEECDALDHAHSPMCSGHMLGMDMGNSEAWAGAGRKIDCSGTRYGGGLERGIYLYYSYRTK